MIQNFAKRKLFPRQGLCFLIQKPLVCPEEDSSPWVTQCIFSTMDNMSSQSCW